MNISAPFVHRPIATALLMIGLLLCGLVTYRLLPVASLPNVNFPTIAGVGLVGIGGQQKPAIRVQVDPQALANRGIALEDVRNVLGQANVDLPKGTLNSPQQSYTLNTNDQLIKPDAYNDLIVAYRSGAPVRIRDIGKVIEAPENDLLAGWYNNQRAVILAIQRQPGA